MGGGEGLKVHFLEAIPLLYWHKEECHFAVTLFQRKVKRTRVTNIYYHTKISLDHGHAQYHSLPIGYCIITWYNLNMDLSYQVINCIRLWSVLMMKLNYYKIWAEMTDKSTYSFNIISLNYNMVYVNFILKIQICRQQLRKQGIRKITYNITEYSYNTNDNITLKINII